MIKLYLKIKSLFDIKFTATDILIALAIYVGALYAYAYGMKFGLILIQFMMMMGGALEG